MNREFINRENTSISHTQSMEKFEFQRSTTPKYQSGKLVITLIILQIDHKNYVIIYLKISLQLKPLDQI